MRGPPSANSMTATPAARAAGTADCVGGAVKHGHRTARRFRRDTERITFALHDEHGHARGGQLGQPVLLRACAAARSGTRARPPRPRRPGRRCGRRPWPRWTGRRPPAAGRPRAPARPPASQASSSTGARGGERRPGHPVRLGDPGDRVAGGRAPRRRPRPGRPSPPRRRRRARAAAGRSARRSGTSSRTSAPPRHRCPHGTAVTPAPHRGRLRRGPGGDESGQHQDRGEGRVRRGERRRRRPAPRRPPSRAGRRTPRR